MKESFLSRLPSPRELPRRAAPAAAGLGALLVLLWLLEITGHAAPRGLSRFLFVAAGLAVAVFLGRLAWRLATRPTPGERPSHGPLLLALLAVAVVVGFAGLAHEVGKGYYTDEGHYLHHAREINAGDLFSRGFIYPHLTYYLDAFALWLAGLFPGLTAAFCRHLYGVEQAAVRDWLVLRLVTASLGTLTLIPVFLLARRLAEKTAGLAEKTRMELLAPGLAGALMIFSSHYQEGFQVNISDVPSAFFATLCLYFTGRLVEREKTRDYLLAGLAAGLAAGAKYPAGVVAVAIFGVWLLHRLARRDGPRSKEAWGLLWAGLVALGVFLATTPSFFVHPDAALHGPRGLLFGVRQYARGGWIGVTPPSNTLYYAARLLENFGWPVVVCAVVGAFGVGRAVWRRLLWIAPFPVAFLVLIASMNMVVLRNLFPVMPALAVVLGVLAAGVVPLLERYVELRRTARRFVLGGVVVLALAWPAAVTVEQTVALARPSTRDAMVAWVVEHVPPGAGILKESYTPDFPPGRYRVQQRRFAFRFPEERFEDERFEYLLLAVSAYGRFFRPENDAEAQAEWYRNVFENWELVLEVRPERFRRGPELRLFRLPRDEDG